MSIETFTPGGTDVAVPVPTITGGGLPGLQILNDWVQASSQAAQLVAPLVTTDFVPAAFRPKGSSPEARNTAIASATAAVLLGMSLGLDPLTSLQQIYVVHGKPAMYTKIKLALAQARGHRVWTEAQTAERAVVCGLRKGDPEDRAVRIEITIEMAQQAGWTSSDMYKKVPADMLWMRACSRVLDRIASDVLNGIASVEDVEPDDRPTEPAPRVTAAEITARVPQQATPAPAEQAPAAEVAPAPVETPVAEPEADGPITDKQWRDINARFVQLNITGPGQNEKRLTVLSAIVERRITRGGELTNAEAALALDNLAGDAGKATVREILAPPATAPDEQPAPDEDAQDYDPTAEADWPMDGAEANTEGRS